MLWPRLLMICCVASLLLFTPPSLAAETALPQPRVQDARQPVNYGCGKANALARKLFREELGLDAPATSTTGQREAPGETDLLHCNLEIEVLPGQSDNIIGVNELKIQSKSANLTEFSFRLRSQYTITSATISPNPGGGGTAVSVTAADTVTRVATLDHTYAMDEVFYLTIAYTGHAESRGFGSIEFTTHNGDEIVYTLSEPYYAYTWWPIKDGEFGAPGDNGDKFTMEMAVIAPDTMVTASNGLLQGIDALSGNRERYRWASDYPIAPYLVCFSTTNYNTWQVNYNKMAGGTMPVYFYIYPEDDTTSTRNAWEEVVQMMYTLRDLYGEYPFVDEKYGIYECEFGGGMEHQTFTAQGTFSEQVTVHELGHQWWGDMITCKHWNDIWLNESFATYTEALWAEFQPGSSGLPALQASMAGKKYFGGGSVYVTASEVGNASAIFDSSTSYAKGGWVLHMLRHVLGGNTFFDALAAYRAAYEGSAATTDDFQAVCEQFYPSGDLDWFFQEWVYGEYTPTYQYGWQSLQVNGNHYLALYIDQTQSGSIQRFSMPIDIRVNGSDTYVVYNDNDPEHFLIPLPAAATTVSFDPDEWILREGLSSTGYVAGPPKIVETSPAPGEVVPCGSNLDTVTVTFHTNVNTSAANYSLVGDVNGAQPISFSYNSGNNTVTLTSTGPLPADEYTLTVNDALTAVNSGQQLDGEITDATDPASLPSGEGVAGGNAVIEFEVAGELDVSRSVGIGFPSGFPDVLAPGEQTDMDVSIIGMCDAVVSSSPTLHYRFSNGSFLTVPLVPAGGNLFRATLPAASCTDMPTFYFTAEGEVSGLTSEPDDAPTSTFELAVGAFSSVELLDNFETDMGWVVSGDAIAGQWERGTPAGGGRGNPDADADGSGQAYVTGNQVSDSDVDDGFTVLTSPPYTATAGQWVSYAYWLNDAPDITSSTEPDTLTVEVAADAAGVNWQLVRTYSAVAPNWRTDRIEIGEEVPASTTLRLRFTATDVGPTDTTIEAGVDDVRIQEVQCGGPPDCTILGDDDMDGVCNDVDACPETADNDPVDENGCSTAGDANRGDSLFSFASCPDDVTIPATSEAGVAFHVAIPSVPPVIHATGTVSIVVDPALGTVFPVGTTAVTLTAFDESSKSVTCHFNVTVTAPGAAGDPAGLVIENSDCGCGDGAGAMMMMVPMMWIGIRQIRRRRGTRMPRDRR